MEAAISFLSDLFGIDDAKAAAQNAARANRTESNAAYNTAQDLQSPYYQGGTQAFNTLNNFLGVNGVGNQANAYQNYMEGPQVSFLRDEGIRALDNSAASRGLTRSGGHEKALLKYGTGLGAQNFNTYLGQLGGVAGAGQNAANALTGARYNSANLTTGANTAEGNAVANASLAGGNMLAGGLGALASLAGGGFGFNPFSLGGSGNGGNQQQQQGYMTGNRFW